MAIYLANAMSVKSPIYADRRLFLIGDRGNLVSATRFGSNQQHGILSTHDITSWLFMARPTSSVRNSACVCDNVE